MFVLTALLPVFAAPSGGNRTVRVGFFAYPGYHEQDEEGRRGYGYDFLILLQRYTNLNFEFVGYDKSWDDMQKMLQNGEIDLVTSARKTLARQALYDFSEPIGTNNGQINVRADDDRFIPGDYLSLDGMTFGVLAGNSRNADARVFAAEKGFAFQEREYATAEALEAALMNGEIDAAVSSSLRKTSGEKTIAEFFPEDFYVIVQKGNAELLEEINYGINQLDVNEGNWRENLHYKNYLGGNEGLLSFTKREQAYIKAVQNGEIKITVAAQPDNDPYSFMENGVLTGIIPDYFSHLMNMAGLPYTVLSAKDSEEYQTWAKTDYADILMDCRGPSAQAGLLTESYMQLMTSRVTRKGFIGEIKTVAGVENQGPKGIGEIAETAEFLIYDSFEAAMKAVEKGDADACYVYSYTAEKYINSYPTADLQATILKEPVYNEYIYVSPNADHELCSILNKCIKADSSGILDNYVKKYTTVTLDNLGIIAYLKLHPSLMMLGSSVLVVLIALFSLAFVRIRTEKIKNQHLQKGMARLQQVKGLASQFTVLYFVNLETLETENNYLDEDQTPEEAKDIDQKSENFFEAFKNSMGVYAHPEYREELLRFGDPAYVREALMNKRRVEFLFPCLNATGNYAWTTMVLMKFTDSETDPPVNIAIGYMDTDVNTRERMEQMKRQERDLEAIRGLADEFDTLQFVDLETDRFSVYYMTDDSPEAAKELNDETKRFSKFFEESMHSFCHPEDLEAMLAFGNPATLREKLFEKNKITRRFLCNSNNGYQWCEFAAIRLDEEPVPKRVAIGYTNIDELVRKETDQQRALSEALAAAEAASQAKTEFLFNMSHDIRTPMNAITGFTDQALRHKEDPAALEAALEKVKDSSAYLLRIINDILDMAKIESGKLEISEKLCCTASGKNTLLVVLGAEAARKGIVFHTDYNTQDRYLWIDENRTNQIMANLISNAIKYTPSGGEIWYSVEQVPCERSGYGRYVVTVKDTGCGMEPEFLSRIFDAFEREESAKRSGVQGTGLGMAIVKKLSDAMGGKLEIQSTLGVGTTVSLTTENRIATPEEIAQLEAQEANLSDVGEVNFAGRKVLLAEDNELNREIAIDLLEEAGMEVEDVDDGSKAVAALKEKGPDAYDCVLMDIQMPTMGGYEATKRIREMYPEATLPIIALSANAFAEDKAASVAAGMNDHVAKPINVKELFGVMAKYLK